MRNGRIVVRWLASIFLLATLLPTGANADLLTYFLRDPSGANPRGLYNFDTNTGVSTLRAAVTSNLQIFAFDVRASDGAVFAVDLGGDLLRIDPDTGQVTVIGNAGAGQLTAIAFRNSDSALFVDNQSALYQLNPNNAAATLIGATPNVDRGLDFSSSGILFGFNADNGNLYTVNPATGSTSFVGGSGAPISILAEDSTFGASGNFYMQDFGGDIFRVNPSTGGRTLVGTAVASTVLGLFTTQQGSPVPEPTSIALVAIGAVLASASATLRRRKAMRRRLN